MLNSERIDQIVLGKLGGALTGLAEHSIPLTFAELTTEFLNKLRELVSLRVKDGDLSADDWNEAVRQARAHAGGKGKAKKRAEAMMAYGEQSYGDMQREIESAFLEKYPMSKGMASPYWVREVYPSGYLIACDSRDQKMYRVPFMREGDGYTFGQFEEVEEEREYVKVANESGYRIFVELSKYAEPPEWIPYLPKPGKFNHAEYGTITITKKRNENFINNFKDAVYQSQLPINAEHKPSEEGAYGWITDMRLNSDDSVDAKVKWTDLGDKAIRNDRFKYISPEFFDEWERKSTGEKFKDVARAAALTVFPFFKEDSMRALVANEQGMFVVSDTQPAHYNRIFNDGNSRFYFTALEPVEGEPRHNNTEVKTMADKPDDAPAKTGMNDDEAQRFTELTGTVKTLSEANESLKTANEQLSTKLTEAQEDNKKLSERVTAMEKEARKTRFTDTAKDFVGKTEDHVCFMEFIADNDEKGEQSEQLKAYVERERATAEQIKTAGLFSEFGHDKTAEAQGALDKMKAAAKKFQEADPKLSDEEAMSLVMDKQPALYNEYLAEREGRAS